MKSKELTLISILATLYAVTGLISISPFIGAPSFLGLNLLIVPVIALTLQPQHAFMSAMTGGLLGLMLASSQAMFGPLSVLLPVIGATLGSLTYNDRPRGDLWTAIFLGLAIAIYAGRGGSLLFVVPHILAVIASILVNRQDRYRIPLTVFASTICEQGMMMILAVLVLGLPGPAFIGILPLMLYERTVATIGGTLLVLGIKRVLK